MDTRVIRTPHSGLYRVEVRQSIPDREPYRTFFVERGVSAYLDRSAKQKPIWTLFADDRHTVLGYAFVTVKDAARCAHGIVMHELRAKAGSPAPIMQTTDGPEKVLRLEDLQNPDYNPHKHSVAEGWEEGDAGLCIACGAPVYWIEDPGTEDGSGHWEPDSNLRVLVLSKGLTDSLQKLLASLTDKSSVLNGCPQPADIYPWIRDLESTTFLQLACQEPIVSDYDPTLEFISDEAALERLQSTK